MRLVRIALACAIASTAGLLSVTSGPVLAARTSAGIVGQRQEGATVRPIGPFLNEHTYTLQIDESGTYAVQFSVTPTAGSSSAVGAFNIVIDEFTGGFPTTLATEASPGTTPSFHWAAGPHKLWTQTPYLLGDASVALVGPGA